MKHYLSYPAIAGAMLIGTMASTATAHPTSQGQDGRGYVGLTDFNLTQDVLMQNKGGMIPGDSQGKKITIINNGPTSGILRAYLIDTKIDGDKSEIFGRELNTTWQGALGSGKAAVNTLGNKKLLGETPMTKGTTTDLYVGVNYPLDSKIVPSRYTPLVAPSSTFLVRLEMTEAYPSANLELKIVPQLPGGKTEVTLGDEIVWNLVISNNGDTVLTDVSDLIEYLSSLGITPSCPGGPLLPSASMTCTAKTKVAQADVDRGYIELSGQARGSLPDGSLILSENASTRVRVVKLSVVPVDPDKPSESPTEPPTGAPTVTPEPTSDPSSPPGDSDGDDDNPDQAGPDSGSDNRPPVGNIPISNNPPVSNPANPVQGVLIKSGELIAENPWKIVFLGSLLMSLGVAFLAYRRNDDEVS